VTRGSWLIPILVIALQSPQVALAALLASHDGEETELPTIPAATTRLLGRLAVSTVAVALVFLSAPVVQAEPTLSLRDLGADSTISFYGDSSTTSLVFPVPVGLTPTTLNGVVDFPFNMRSGTLTVTQGDRRIGRIELPLTDLAPLVIPLDGVEIVDESVSVTLTLTALPDDGYCLDPLHPIEFINGSITYNGAEIPPNTVADFLPPILRTLTIGVPAAPSEAESEAAVQLAAAMTARYRAQGPQVAVVPLADGTTFAGPAQPMERRIIVKEGPDEGLSLIGAPGVPDLLISGPAEKLSNESRLLTDPSLNLATSAKVIPGDLRSPNAALPGDSTTLTALGQPNLTGAGVAPQVSIALDQTRFGHATQGFRVHLLGMYTPVPADVGSTLTASIGEEIIQSWPTEPGGAIDHWVEIPDRLIQRYTNLIVGLETSGNIGRCGEFRPIKLTIDGSSVVESTPANPPIPTGFGSLPQSLMPEVQIGIKNNDLADTVRSAQISVGLQRLSVVPLSIELGSLEEAIKSDGPAILISPDGWADQSISLPVSAEDGRLNLEAFNSEGKEPAQTTLTLDPAVGFGSLQTVLEGNRSLLVATSNGAPGELDRLLGWLTTDPSRWSELRGNVVVAIAGREPEMVPDRAPLTVYGPPTSPTETSDSTDGISPWWAAAGVGAAIVIGVAAFWLGTRRTRIRSGRSVDGGDGQP
jgi:hypothetical protein